MTFDPPGQKCQVHDWPSEGLRSRIAQAITDRKNGINVCSECLERAKADK